MYKQYLSFHLDFHQNRFYRPNPYIYTNITNPGQRKSQAPVGTNIPIRSGNVDTRWWRTLCISFSPFVGGWFVPLGVGRFVRHMLVVCSTVFFLLLSTRYPGCKARKTHPPPEHNVCVWSLGRADKREKENARPVAFIIPGHVPE